LEEEIEMNKAEYKDGIMELKIYFSHFKPTDDQIRIWFDRLKHFTADEWRLAVFRLTEEKKTAPGFADLKSYLFSARKKIANKTLELPEPQGWAPETPEKKELLQDGLRQLLRLMAATEKEIPNKKQQLDDLKLVMQAAYKTLPGYLTEQRVQALINQGNYGELLRIGFITEHTPKPDVFIPAFSVEARQAIEPAPAIGIGDTGYKNF
jgi:hypothetical protein